MSETEPNLESWDGFLTNFLKADNIPAQEGLFECVDVKKMDYPNRDPVLSLALQRDKEKFSFDLNVTNMAFLRKAGMKKPVEIIGKKITIGKVKVMNPTSKQEVDGLRIVKVEGLETISDDSDK